MAWIQFLVARLLSIQCYALSSFSQEIRLAVYPFKYKFSIKILSLSLNTMLIVDNTAVTSAVTNFWCHKLITKVNK